MELNEDGDPRCGFMHCGILFCILQRQIKTWSYLSLEIYIVINVMQKYHEFLILTELIKLTMDGSKS